MSNVAAADNNTNNLGTDPHCSQLRLKAALELLLVSSTNQITSECPIGALSLQPPSPSTPQEPQLLLHIIRQLLLPLNPPAAACIPTRRLPGLRC